MRHARSARRLWCAVLLCALAFALIVPAIAFAEDSMQNTLEDYTPEGQPEQRKLVPDWPRHPTDAEMQEAAKRITIMVGWLDEMEGWKTANELASIDEIKTYKVHLTGKDPAFMGDKTTGDAVLLIMKIQRYQWEQPVDPVDGMSMGNGYLDMTKTQPMAVWARLAWDPAAKQFEYDSVLAGISVPKEFYDRFGYAPGWAGGAGVDEAEGPLPWKNVVGGLLAVTAAATAIAGAAATSAAKSDKKLDPKQPVGYVLQVSTPRLTVSSAQWSQLEVTAWRVLANASTELASDAAIALAGPPGLRIEPAAGQGTVVANVLLAGDVHPSAGIRVSAQAGGGGAETIVHLTSEEESKLTLEIEGGARELIASGADSVTVIARLAVSPLDAAKPGNDPSALRAGIEFTMGSEWLDPSPPVEWPPDGRAISVQASQPNPDHPVQPPESASLTAAVTVAGKPLSASISIPIARNPEIDAKPDTVEFFAESQDSIDSLVWIDHGGAGQWEFSATWRENHRPLAKYEIERTSPTAATIHLTEASKGLPPIEQAEESSQLVVRATSQGYEPLERYIKVIVAREGLFIASEGRNPDGSFHVFANGKNEASTIRFRVFARDANGAIAYSAELAEALEFAPADEEGSVPYNIGHVADLSLTFDRPQPGEPPAAVYSCLARRPIPADAPIVHVRYTVSVPGRDQDCFFKPLTLGLRPAHDAPGGPDWKLELDRCKKIILDYVPYAYQPQLMGILERRAQHLGADGLYALRKQIWMIAQNLTLGEGGQGYLEEAKWADRITTVLDYAQWAGDIAFHAATAHFIGPYYAMGAAQLKSLVVSAIVAYEEGLTPEEWLWQNLGAIPALFEGQIVDVDKFSKIPGSSKAKAWALFISYHFFKSYFYDKKSFTDSLIEAGRQARDEAIASWLGDELRKGPKVDVQTPKGPKGKGPAGPSAQTRGREMGKRVLSERGADGKISAKTTAEIMRDPDAAREMKRLSPEAYKAYVKTREGMRAAHDAELKGRLADRYPPGTKVRVETVGTEGGIDRDVRVTREVPDPQNPGKTVWVEIPRGDWEGDSHQIFGKQTGAPDGATPAELAKHAQEHQHLTTDKKHHEACADMSDQIDVPGPDGKPTPTQRTRTDPKTGKQVPASNLDLVKDGQGKLIDSKELGRTYENKVRDSMPKGADGTPQPTKDAFTQAKKAGDTLAGVKEGYGKRGVPTDPIDPKVQQGRHIADKVAKGEWDAAEGDRRLRQSGFPGGLADYIKAVSGQIGSLPDTTH